MADFSEDELRSVAVKRLKERADLLNHLVAYFVINAALIAIWAVTGHGYFWPGWVLGGWGIGLALHAWNTLWQRPITQEQVNREMERLRRHSGPAAG